MSEIVEEANLILAVHCTDTFIEEVLVKSVTPGVLVPPFKKKGFIFQVTGILKNTTGQDVPAIIHVPKEEWRRSLSQHKTMYAEGPSKSYEVKHYDTPVKAMNHADILFLHRFQDTFELEVKGSFEYDACREKIEMLIANE